MNGDISGFGSQIILIASNTFPVGYSVTQYADDVDPFDLPELQIADTAMGNNGDLISWSKPAPIEFKLALIPGGDDDINLGTIMQANRVGKGKSSAGDIITVTGIYKSTNRLVTLTNGRMIKGMPGDSFASSGRLKTKTYTFHFENYTFI